MCSRIDLFRLMYYYILNNTTITTTYASTCKQHFNFSNSTFGCLIFIMFPLKCISKKYSKSVTKYRIWVILLHHIPHLIMFYYLERGTSCSASTQSWLPLKHGGLHHSQTWTLSCIFSACGTERQTVRPQTPAASRGRR